MQNNNQWLVTVLNRHDHLSPLSSTKESSTKQRWSSKKVKTLVFAFFIDGHIFIDRQLIGCIAVTLRIDVRKNILKNGKWIYNELRYVF